jgi:hypothetical protein
VIPSVNRKFYIDEENILLRIQKAKTGPQSPKTEFGLQNQYDRETYPSIGNLTWSKKKFSFGGQKGEIKPL